MSTALTRNSSQGTFALSVMLQVDRPLEVTGEPGVMPVVVQASNIHLRRSRLMQIMPMPSRSSSRRRPNARAIEQLTRTTGVPRPPSRTHSRRQATVSMVALRAVSAVQAAMHLLHAAMPRHVVRITGHIYLPVTMLQPLTVLLMVLMMPLLLPMSKLLTAQHMCRLLEAPTTRRPLPIRTSLRLIFRTETLEGHGVSVVESYLAG